MNFRSLLPVLAAVGLLQGADSRLLEVRRLYVLPMSGGLDQYLANRLTHNGRYVVVTDPTRADALLTDSLGPAFEDKYKELYPPPAPPEGSKEAKDVRKDKDDKSVMSMMTTGAGTQRTSSFSRGKGNVFLVDRASRQVLWSTFLKPRNTSAAEMNRVADQIADRIDDAAEHREKADRKAAKAGVVPPPPPAAIVPPPPVATPSAVAAPAPVAPTPPADAKPAPVPPAAAPAK